MRFIARHPLVIAFVALPFLMVTAHAQPTSDASPQTRSVIKAVADTGGVLVLEGDAPVLYYQRETMSLGDRWPRAHYVHPLYGLDGEILTEDFPEDHGHHRGVFWAWHQVRVGDQLMGDSWTCQDFIWDVIGVQTSQGPESLALLTDVLWKSPRYRDESGAMIPIVREQTTITAIRSSAAYRLIDFEITLRALVDGVQIGGSQDRKGYGGFSPRIKLDKSQQFSSSTGPVEPITTAVSAGRWIDIAGDDFGIAMLTHPENPKPRNEYILRRQRSMQNAVYPGRDAVPLSTTQPTILRYRLVVHRGDLDAAAIERLADDFGQTPE